MSNEISVTIPIFLVSSLNKREHWTVRRQRNNHQNLAVMWSLPTIENKLPCTVKLIRIAPRKLDDDNLIGAFKHIRDCVADLLIPGKKAGHADSDPRITWLYGQEQARLPAIRIEISPSAP